MIHVPSPLYPADWRPECAEDVWESEPTTWERAVAAWCAAASAAAGPLYPPELAALAGRAEQYGAYADGPPSVAALIELHEEAGYRAEWLPTGCDHSYTVARPDVWEHRNNYGLCWHSSVQTILARTAPGWVVRIIGKHEARQRAAEHVLGAGACR